MAEWPAAPSDEDGERRRNRDNVTVSVVNNDNSTGYVTGTGNINVTAPRPVGAPAPAAPGPSGSARTERTDAGRAAPEAGKRYDVCLSFAGEQRSYVEAVAGALREHGVTVFYDAYEAVTLWGVDLYQHLAQVYGEISRFCVVFASADFAAKVWTGHELRNAQARAIRERVEYILPARFDDTPIPGIPWTTGYVDLRGMSPETLVEMIVSKVRGSPTGS